MLVLSRKKGEAIAIESDIEIEILEIRKGRVRLGIRAPRTRKIIRAEIADSPLGAAYLVHNGEEAEHRPHRRPTTSAASSVPPHA